MLPYVKETKKSRVYIDEFRGYNHNERISEKEIYDGYNVTNDEYPMLKTRRARSLVVDKFSDERVFGVGEDQVKKTVLVNPTQVFFEGDTLSYFYCEDNNLSPYLHFGEEKLHFSYEVAFDVDTSGEARRLVRMGRRHVVMPHLASFIYEETRDANNQIQKKITSEMGSDKLVKSFKIENVMLTESDDGVVDCTPIREYAEINKLEIKYDVKSNANGEKVDVIYTVDSDGNETDITRDVYVKISGADDEIRNVYERQLLKEGVIELGSIVWIESGNEALSKSTSGIGEYLATDIGFSSIKACAEGIWHVIVFGRLKVDSIEIENGISLKLPYWSTRVLLEEELVMRICGYYVPPIMDFVIECQNRLWGCRYGKNRKGEFVNELYCTRLGTYNEWHTYDNLADSSWTAGVGSPGPFTAAVSYDNNPIFFKEDVAYKVYISSTGAHRVVPLDIRGVEEGSEGSLAFVNENLVYKGRDYVFIFNGSSVTPISAALGERRYKNAVAGAEGDKYVMYCEDENGGRHIFTYDFRRGFWQRELCDKRCVSTCNHDGRLYMLFEAETVDEKGNVVERESSLVLHSALEGEECEKDVRYMFETGFVGFETPSRKYICRLDLRLMLELGTSFSVWIQYDSDGRWVQLSRYIGNLPLPKAQTIHVMPRRCDHFKLRITGTGKFKLYSITRIYEESEW